MPPIALARDAAAALLALALTACVAGAPVGMSSGASMVGRDVELPFDAVLDGAQEVLRELGDVWDIQRHDEHRATLRTGRARIIIERRDAETTLLIVYLQEFVGTDHREQTEALWQRIVDAARAS